MKIWRFFRQGFFTVVKVCMDHPELAKFIVSLARAVIDGKISWNEKERLKKDFNDLMNVYF